MIGPDHKRRALTVLMLLPLLAAAGEQPCLLCANPTENTAVSTAKATPLSIDITTQLDFSRAALSGSSGGQIDVDPHNGSRRVDGSIIDLGGPAFAGTAIVRGEPGRAIRIDMPQTANMTSSTGAVIKIVGLRASIVGNPRLDHEGRLSFSFGGKLVVQGNASGTFRARIPITAQYE
jgi:hypothetical protein